MAEGTRRPPALAVLASFCLVVVGAVVWEMQHGTPSHWALAERHAGDGYCSCTWHPARPGEFEEEWTEFQSSDGGRMTLRDAGQTDSDLGRGQRRDAMASSETYDGLEGPLRLGTVAG